MHDLKQESVGASTAQSASCASVEVFPCKLETLVEGLSLKFVQIVLFMKKNCKADVPKNICCLLYS